MRVEVQIWFTTVVLILAKERFSDAHLQSISGHRIVSYQDINANTGSHRFSHENLDDFSRILIDSSRSQLIVGARNHILRLDMHDLKLLEMVEWKPGIVNVTTCLAKGQTEEVCHNFIRVMLLHNNTVFVCGTNAFSPVCSRRNPLRLEKVESWLSGVAKCPFDPQHNSTALLTKDGNLYTATVTDFTSRDPAISRLIGPSKHLRSVQHNSRWLNEPDFVSSYEIGEYVYFFFREAAIEYINCGKAVYSRVARICKSDTGGRKFLLDDNWTTFVKARLNCSIGGDYPFYFNELQDTYYVEASRLVYALFNTPSTSIYGSAVCVYSVEDIDKAFTQSYKYQADASMAWIREPNLQPNFQCPDSEYVAEGSGATRNLVDAQKFQLMDQAIQPLNLAPLASFENQRYIRLIVDNLKISTKGFDRELKVLFLATLEGSIDKISIVSSEHRMNWTEFGKDSENSLRKNRAKDRSFACLVESLQLSNTDRSGYILSMKLYKSVGSLFISTTDSVVKLPVERCSVYSTKRQCINAQDPYCGWIDVSHEIGRCAATGNNNLSSCPVADPDPVDGHWSDWSEWQYCHHTYFALSTTDDNCRCRTRSCSNPIPQHGGRVCVGHAVEVANCSVPKHFTAFGRWSDWGAWSDCSSDCGSGHMTRTRTCLPILPEFSDNINCIGNSVEWRECKGARCTEVQKFNDWSRWFKTSLGEGLDHSLGYKEERYRCKCSASGIEPALLSEPSFKTEARYCPGSGSACKTEPVLDVDGGWSDWSEWSKCSVSCSEGVQTRIRRCDSPLPEGNGAGCSGPVIEHRTCALQPCFSSARWSCWSDFTPCSVSCGEGGWKQRTRKCEGGNPGGGLCEGESTEFIECQGPPCPGEPELDNLRLSPNITEVSQHSIQPIHWYIIAALGGFILAIPLTLLMTILCQRHRKRHREWTKRMEHRVKVQSNEYSSAKPIYKAQPNMYYSPKQQPKFHHSDNPSAKPLHDVNSNQYSNAKQHHKVQQSDYFGGKPLHRVQPNEYSSNKLLSVDKSPSLHHYQTISPYMDRKMDSKPMYTKPPLTVQDAKIQYETLARKSYRTFAYGEERGQFH